MGTNFYWLGSEDDDEPCDGETPRGHIGKRSASGLWCYDCDRTLCPGGVTRVHMGDSRWPTECPSCGASRFKGDRVVDEDSPVRGSCSWSWAVKPDAFWKLLDQGIRPAQPMDAMEMAEKLKVFLGEYAHHGDAVRLSRDVRTLAWTVTGGQKADIGEPLICDEYGKTFTAEEFRKVVDGCKIHFTDSVGRAFS